MNNATIKKKKTKTKTKVKNIDTKTVSPPPSRHAEVWRFLERDGRHLGEESRTTQQRIRRTSDLLQQSQKKAAASSLPFQRNHLMHARTLQSVLFELHEHLKRNTTSNENTTLFPRFTSQLTQRKSVLAHAGNAKRCSTSTSRFQKKKKKNSTTFFFFFLSHL